MLFDRGLLETGVLGLAFHHLVIDALSVSIFVTALQYAYADARSGKVAKRDVEPIFGRWLLAMDVHVQRAAQSYYEALERVRENCHVELYISMNQGVLAWTLQYAPAFCDEAKARALGNEIGAFVQALAAVEQ